MATKSVIPYGFRVIRLLSILSIIVTLFTLVSVKSLLVGNSSIFFSTYSIVSMIFSVAFSVLIIVAINKKSSKLYKPVIWLVIVEIIIFLLSIIFWGISRLVEYVIIIIPSLFFLWYWIKMKGYFIDPSFNREDPSVKKIDKKVNPFLITWIILVVVVSIASAGLYVAGTVKDAVKYAKSFENKTLQENIVYCEAQTERDNCLIFAFSFEKDKSNVTSASCDLLSDENIKVGCYALINRCDLVKDEGTRTICEIGAKDFENDRQSTSSQPVTNSTP